MIRKQDGTAAAVIPAAGIGRRMGPGKPKQYLELNGRSIFVLTLEAFEACSEVEEVILVVPQETIGWCRELVDKYRLEKVLHIVAGGKERQNSVANGLAAVSGHIDIVAVHDGVRPLVKPELIRRVIDAAKEYGAAVPVLPVADTVKSGDGTWVKRTVDRNRLWRVQTPQCFHKAILTRAYGLHDLGGMKVTDSAGLVELLGQKVFMVPGDESNLKITTPADLRLAEYYLQAD